MAYLASRRDARLNTNPAAWRYGAAERLLPRHLLQRHRGKCDRPGAISFNRGNRLIPGELRQFARQHWCYARSIVRDLMPKSHIRLVHGQLGPS